MFDRALETLDTFEATIAKLLVAARGIHKNSTDSSLTAAADKPDGLDVVASAVKARQDYNDSLARLSSILIEIETIKTNTESTTTENQTLSDDEVAKLESKRTELLSQISEIKQQKRTISKHIQQASQIQVTHGSIRKRALSLEYCCHFLQYPGIWLVKVRPGCGPDSGVPAAENVPGAVCSRYELIDEPQQRYRFGPQCQFAVRVQLSDAGPY
ncbi:hypothetical protein GQ42DRAFT_158438 [Ramicandelaber brevisporus]|nr:hypothetical protein GQ42DRAFT_158438 [Ramicandelaber brevisporus]